MSNDLTLLLLLKNRHAFTLRWVAFHQKYLQHINLYIADGSDLRFQSLEPAATIENCQYAYTGPDFGVSEFISKAIEALSAIQTKYVSMQSNDDLVGPNALEQAVQFLDSNADFVLAYGGSVDFSINIQERSPYYGKVINVSKEGLILNYLDQQPKNRVLSYLEYSKSFWHAVIRREALLNAWIFAREANIQSIKLLEQFLNLYLVTIGKFRNFENPVQLFHQVHPEMLVRSYKYNQEGLDSEIFVKELDCAFNHLGSEFKSIGLDSHFWNLARARYVSIETQKDKNKSRNKLTWRRLVKQKALFELSKFTVIQNIFAHRAFGGKENLDRSYYSEFINFLSS